MFDYAHYSQSCMVEGLDSWRDSLSWSHVVLEECEGTHYQLLYLESLLKQGVIGLTNRIQALETWQIRELLLPLHTSSKSLLTLSRRLRPQKVWQKLLMRNQLQPGECKSWIMVRIEILEEVRHAEKNQKLSFLVKAIRVIDGCKDVHQHPVVWSLIELYLFGSVLLIKHFANELEDFCHEFVLIEAEHSQKNHDELDKAVDVSKIKSICRPFLSALISIDNSFLDTRTHHNFTKAHDAHSS